MGPTDAVQEIGLFQFDEIGDIRGMSHEPQRSFAPFKPRRYRLAGEARGNSRHTGHSLFSVSDDEL
jgi:hypothetical protein